jgi:hypothetical protein
MKASASPCTPMPMGRWRRFERWSRFHESVWVGINGEYFIEVECFQFFGILGIAIDTFLRMPELGSEPRILMVIIYFLKSFSAEQHRLP